MSKMYYEQDANPALLKGKKIAILGYGSQGRSQSLNLRDSGCYVELGLRHGGKSWQHAEKDGWTPKTFEAAATDADIIAFLTPDMAQRDVYEEYVKPHLKEGATLLFAHGFSVLYERIKPEPHCDVVMVAPKSPGHLVRTEYKKQAGVPCLIAVSQDASGHAKGTALAFANAIGGTRAGVIETTFKDETETDLFGEQAVLCGGVVDLINQGYETLVEGGYTEEMAYFECLHEMKLIVDLFYEGGISRMREFCSDTANYGGLTRGPRVVNQDCKARMKEVLNEIQSGEFAREWSHEWDNNQGKYFKELHNTQSSHSIEKVGAKLRNHMGWLKKDK